MRCGAGGAGEEQEKEVRSRMRRYGVGWGDEKQEEKMRSRRRRQGAGGGGLEEELRGRERLNGGACGGAEGTHAQDGSTDTLKIWGGGWGRAGGGST